MGMAYSRACPEGLNHRIGYKTDTLAPKRIERHSEATILPTIRASTRFLPDSSAKDTRKMTHTARWIRTVLVAVLVVVSVGIAAQARANDLPLAAASPLTGVAFDDRPLLLPVQRNFQMAMLTAGSELGRSCGKMEAYGWRMSQTEQGRVNQIFNNTVDRMRMMGYAIEPQTLTSVSNDITLFTADKADKHFIFLWSAGELGLVMNLCETSAPIAATYRPSPLVPSVQIFPVPQDVVSQRLEMPSHMLTRAADEAFTPLGEWVGSYTCQQGYTGGSMQITHLEGKDFEGSFKFYPTPKNPNVPAGAYHIYGQYDKTSHRILINPGKWIDRPANFYNTVITGAFDPARDTFSAYFQGISGCTSFEAKRAGEPYVDTASRKKTKKKHVVKKKKPVHKPFPTGTLEMPTLTPPPAAPVTAPAAAPLTPVSTSMPAPDTSSGITLSAPPVHK
jgi:hypothetical protein